MDKSRPKIGTKVLLHNGNEYTVRAVWTEDTTDETLILVHSPLFSLSTFLCSPEEFEKFRVTFEPPAEKSPCRLVALLAAERAFRYAKAGHNWEYTCDEVGKLFE